MMIKNMVQIHDEQPIIQMTILVGALSPIKHKGLYQGYILERQRQTDRQTYTNGPMFVFVTANK